MKLKNIFITILAFVFTIHSVANFSDVVTQYNEDVPRMLQDVFWGCKDVATVGWSIATEDIPSIALKLWWYARHHPQFTFVVAALLTTYLYARSQSKRTFKIEVVSP